MGGFLAGGDKQWQDAQTYSYASQIEQQFADERAQRRSFLQDIRQARMAQAYNEWAASATDEYVTTSGTAGATGNIFSNFSGAYRYAIDQSASSERISLLNSLSEKMAKRAAKRDERAATAASYITAGAAIVGSIFGPIGTVIGAGIGNLAVRGLHGGKAAIKASNKQAISSVVTAGAMSAASAASTALSSSANTAVTEAGGGMSSGYTASTTGASTVSGGATEIWKSPTTTSWIQPRQAPSFLSQYRYNAIASLGSNLYRRQY